ncbi:MAG: winged helix-turn-helix transcriptional regulator [Thermoplasmata archaeon]|nr:winged helix-turn-helix transcriptional regulator [Thermoplasmata archaeon]
MTRRYRINEYSKIRYISLMAIFLAIFVLAMHSSIVASNTQGAHLYAPTKDVSSQKNLDIVITYENLHVKSGGTLTFFVKVTEQGYPVNGSTIIFTADSPDFCTFEYENSGLTDADGMAVVQMVAYSEKGTILNITAKAYLEDYMPGYYEINEITIEPPVVIINNENISYISITGLIALTLIGLTESGKYGLLKTFFLPLYSRIKKDDLLDHFVRGQIYGYIMSHPGEHYNRIKNKLKVTNGTLSHHLRALEFQGYIKSQRDGTYKRFYPTGMKIQRTKGIQLSDLQIGIVDAIRQSPGISQKEIAHREGISQQSVSYNLTLLQRMGILDNSREGVRKKYYISTEA